jgi:hypothetical protein
MRPALGPLWRKSVLALLAGDLLGTLIGRNALRFATPLGPSAALRLASPQLSKKPRQLRDIRRDAPRLVAGEQVCRGAPARPLRLRFARRVRFEDRRARKGDGRGDNLSAARGWEPAVIARAALEREMTRAQIAQAQNLARDWRPKKEGEGPAGACVGNDVFDSGDVGGDAPGLVVKLSVHLLIPVPILPPEMDGIEQVVRVGGGHMGKLGDACRVRATECALVGRAAGWRGENALKAMYLALAHQWLDIAEIGDAADQERDLRDLMEKLDCYDFDHG